MFESLNGVDWGLLHRQKLTLLKLRQRQPEGSAEAVALSGVIHLLDTLQDDALTRPHSLIVKNLEVNVICPREAVVQRW